MWPQNQNNNHFKNFSNNRCLLAIDVYYLWNPQIFCKSITLVILTPEYRRVLKMFDSKISKSLLSNYFVLFDLCKKKASQKCNHNQQDIKGLGYPCDTFSLPYLYLRIKRKKCMLLLQKICASIYGIWGKEKKNKRDHAIL